MVRRRTKAKEQTMKRIQFLSLLKKVHLAGAINECVIVLDEGSITIEVVDITNNVVVIANDDSAGPKAITASIGLGNIETLVKFLSSINDPRILTNITEEGSRFTLGSKGWKRKLNYLTSLPEMISTRLRMEEGDEEDYEGQFKNIPEVVFYLDQEDAKDIVSYLGVLKSKLVTIEVSGKVAKFILGTRTEHQFELEVPLTKRTSKEFSVMTNGDNLAKVFGVVDFKDDEMTTVGVAEGSPVVVQDGNAIWGLTPIEDMEGE